MHGKKGFRGEGGGDSVSRTHEGKKRRVGVLRGRWLVGRPARQKVCLLSALRRWRHGAAVARFSFYRSSCRNEVRGRKGEGRRFGVPVESSFCVADLAAVVRRHMFPRAPPPTPFPACTGEPKVRGRGTDRQWRQSNFWRSGATTSAAADSSLVPSFAVDSYSYFG